MLRAAVIGASGIGKQHAKWLDGLGLDIVAFVGSSPESTQRTAEVLESLFGFQGRAYCDVGQMLAAQGPDIVVVSSPPARHKEHSIAALRAGCHVMCEKPIVWSATPGPELRHEAQAIASAARESGKLLSVNTQYVAAVPYVRDIHREARQCGLERPESVFFEIESKGGGGAHEYGMIFADLVPHPISFLLAAVPGAQVVHDSIDCQVGRKETIVALECTRPDGGTCRARFELRNIADGKPKRRFGINDLVLAYEGRADQSGEFRACLLHGQYERVYDDFVLTNMERFVAAVQGRGDPLVDIQTALTGFDLQLDILARHRRV